MLLLATFAAGAAAGGYLVDRAHRDRPTVVPADPGMIECLRDLEAARKFSCPTLPDCWLPCPADGG